MATSPTRPKSRAEQALDGLCCLDWITGSLLAKASKLPALVSPLTDAGFLQRVLREARLLTQNAEAALRSKAVQDKLLANTNVNWPDVGRKKQREFVLELSRLIQGMPSRITPGARAILTEQGQLMLDDTHRALGAKHKVFGVDPVFALRNDQAVEILRDTTAIAFAPHYESQAQRFRERAQRQLSEGLDQGLGRKEIGQRLRAEFSETTISESYWETVAAVHVNRARSYTQAVTYAENGCTHYEVLNPDDRRTTPICRMMNGTILSIESALDQFDQLESSVNAVGDYDKAMPFMRRSGNRIHTPNGTTIAEIKPGGGFSGKLTPAAMNAEGVNMPPYHFRCRTTVLPVLGGVEGLSPPKPVKVQPDPPKPPKAPKTKPDEKPAKKPSKLEEDPSFDPIRHIRSTMASGPEKDKALRKTLLEQVRDGRGLPPGDLGAAYYQGGTDKTKAKTTSKLLSEEFRKIGRQIVESDPELAKAWNAALAARAKDDYEALELRAQAVRMLNQKTYSMGAEQIPEGEREARRKAFIKLFEDRATQGVATGGHLEFKSTGKKLSPEESKLMGRYAGEVFDAWGPVAESAMQRIKTVYFAKGRACNDDNSRYLTFRDRGSFHHEVGHSIENHLIAPRGFQHDHYNPVVLKPASYWANRVEQRQPGKPTKLSVLTGNKAYADFEVAKKDKWGDFYMGKVYGVGSSEVVAMLTEARGGNLSRWRKQFDEDPDTLLEFLGYQLSSIRGEATFRQRGGRHVD